MTTLDDRFIGAARAHGAKIEQQQSGAWMVLDEFGQPDFSYGIMSSEAAAAMAYCERHKIEIELEDEEPSTIRPTTVADKLLMAIACGLINFGAWTAALGGRLSISVLNRELARAHR